MSSSAACLMAARFGLEDSTVVFHFEGMLCDGLCASVGYNKPATCTCSVLDPSVKQQMPWELASILSELSLFFVVLECLFFAINVCARTIFVNTNYI